MGYFFHQGAVNYLDSIKAGSFDDIALELFRFQYAGNAVYRSFVDALSIQVQAVRRIADIPFLPVSFFKTHEVICGERTGKELVFKSSTTTSDIPAWHIVSNPDLYVANLINGFRQFYGEPADYTILALLPSYLQREGASLVYMVERLMEQSGREANGFYLDEHKQLFEVLQGLEAKGEKTLLVGVTFALLDFAEKYQMTLANTIVMETGGMKGRRKEQTRAEVHNILKQRLGVSGVHSEYGMTELLSQAYSQGDGLFKPADTMKVLVRDQNDPLDVSVRGAGILDIIDLANIYSCAFIATDDIGRIYDDGTFEVLGRADNSALRGCNLMVV